MTTAQRSQPDAATGNSDAATSEPDPVADVEQRRGFLGLLATVTDTAGLLDGMAAATGQTEREALLLAVRMLAAELIRTGVELYGAREQLAEHEVGLKMTGALSAGLLGLKRDDATQDDGSDVAALLGFARHTGAQIRTGAGLAPMSAP